MISNVTSIFADTDIYLEKVPGASPPIQAAIVLITSLFLAFVIWSVFKRVFLRIAKNTDTDVDDRIIQKAQMPGIMITIVSGLFLAGKLLNVDAIFGRVYLHSYLTFLFFLIVVLVYQMSIILMQTVRSTVAIGSVRVFDRKIYPVFELIIKFLFAIVYMFILFGIWGIDIAPLLASAGIFGVALAFAAQDTVANFFGGISLFMDKTYKIGDFIIMDNQDRGDVVDISLRSTKIRTRNNELVSIPNSVLASSKIINETGHDPKIRLAIDVDIAYGEDLQKVEDTLLAIAHNQDYILSSPGPRVRFRGFKDYSIGVQFLFWIEDPEYKGKRTHQVIKLIYDTFNREGIKFPYPVRDVLLRKK